MLPPNARNLTEWQQFAADECLGAWWADACLKLLGYLEERPIKVCWANDCWAEMA